MQPGERPQSVLFACGLNSIRSPMAMALFRHLFGKSMYTGSAGVKPGEQDPFAIAVMDEIGLDIAKHRPQTFEQLEDWEGLNFDLIVTLSPEAHHKALEPDPDGRRRGGILADAGPERYRRHPGAEARRLPDGARPAHGQDQGAVRRAGAGRGLSRRHFGLFPITAEQGVRSELEGRRLVRRSSVPGGSAATSG